MKAGSLVKAIGIFSPTEKKLRDQKIAIDQGYIIPVRGEIYTVREFTASGSGILLEEIVNHKIRTTFGLTEVGFNRKGFLEVQPPLDLKELLNECLYASI